MTSKIMVKYKYEQGLIEESFADYLADPALSQSQLKQLNELTPRQFWYNNLSPDREVEEPTDAMKLGSAVHMATLEFQKFKDEYVEDRTKDFNKTYKVQKAQYEEWKLSVEGKSLITKSDMTMVLRMRDALLSKKVWRILCRNGYSERSLYWKDPLTGIVCKARMDYFIEPCEAYPNGLILDLKTTANASKAEFSKSIYNYGYYNQLAWYSEGVRVKYDREEYPKFIFCAIEKKRPYDSNFFNGTQLMLRIGLMENKKLLNLFADCKNNDRWPGYLDQVQDIDLPMWTIDKFNFEEEL